MTQLIFRFKFLKHTIGHILSYIIAILYDLLYSVAHIFSVLYYMDVHDHGEWHAVRA